MTNLKSNNTNHISENCRHCQRRLTPPQKEKGFCCHGCETVYHFITGQNLEQFYQFAGEETKELPSFQNENLLELFDDDIFQKDFVEISQDSRTAHLFLGGISCYACIWLIEHAFSKHFPNATVSTSLTSQTLTIVDKLSDKIKLSSYVQLLKKLGYAVSPALEDHETSKITELVRLGVNTFCFLNIMLLSVADYLDPEFESAPLYWSLFRYIMFGFSCIIMTYGASPIYSRAINNLKWRRPTVDLSLVIALGFTFIYSVWNTIQNHGDVYFDSIGAIVTLIGWGRFFQDSILRRAEQSIRGVFDYGLQYVRKKTEQEEKIVPLHSIKPGNIILALPSDPIPIECQIQSGTSNIHYEQLTGESKPQLAKAGDTVKAGAINLSSRLELKAMENGADSIVSKLNQMVDQLLSQKGHFTQISDKLATAFFFVVLLISFVILLSHWSQSPEEAVRRSISALLIACPCAFALAVPLTMATALVDGIKQGIILKSHKTIEKLAQLHSLFFDKTGTLTTGRPAVEHFESYHMEALSEEKQQDFWRALATLKHYSLHHIAQTLSDYSHQYLLAQHDKTPNEELVNFKEESGMGVSFEFEGVKYKIGNNRFCHIEQAEKNHANTFIIRSGEHFASVLIDDQLVADAKETVDELKKLHLKVGLISGDSMVNSLKTAKDLGLQKENIFANQSPEKKITPLKQNSNNHFSLLDSFFGHQPRYQCMVGNGFNDTLALSAADLGIAVSSSNQAAKDAADAFIMKPGLLPIIAGISIAKLAKKKILSAYAFSIAFNLFGLALAATGYMHPVMAAILMPVSSSAVTTLAIGWRWKRER